MPSKDIKQNGKVVGTVYTPTEDTPTPNVNKTGHLVDVASTNVNSVQDDKQLREAIASIVTTNFAAIPKSEHPVEGTVDWHVNKLLALFTTAQQQSNEYSRLRGLEKGVEDGNRRVKAAQLQLLAELLEQKVQTYSHMISFVDAKHHIKPDIEAVPVSALEHKKQELERGK